MRNVSMEKTVTIRLIEFNSTQQLVQPIEYDLSFTMTTYFDSPDEIDEAQLNQDISFSKILFFLSEVIDQSLVFDADNNSELFNKFQGWHNNIIVLPEVVPYYFMSAIHAKLNTISKDTTKIQKIRLYDKTDKVSYEFFKDDDDLYYELPDDDSWLGESKLRYWSGCWWNRPDIGTMDRIAETQEEYDLWLQVKTEQKIDELNMYPFNEIEKDFYNTDDDTCEVIPVDFTKSKDKRTGWKPVIVE